MYTFFHHSSKRQTLVWLFVGLFGLDLLASATAFAPQTRTRSKWKPNRRFSGLTASVDNVVHQQHQCKYQQYSKDNLNALTVKELRTILKDSGLNQRGVISRLKLKRDLVAFLHENLKQASENEETNTKISISTSPHSLPDSETAYMDKCMPSEKEPLPSREVQTAHTPRPKQPLTMPAATDTQTKGLMSPKDALFQKVYQKYPPLQETNCTGTGENDIRQIYHPIFQNANKTSSDMDIIFVGTASCTPGVTRGVSCTALRLNWKRRALQGAPEGTQTVAANDFAGGTWLFDCGECTQLQVQRTPSLKPSKISKIFISHAHGDHSFGLPGLLCLMGQDRDRASTPPVDIYGPEGLRMWLRVAIRYSVSRIVPNYRVHELKDIPMAPEWQLNRRAGRYVYRGIGKKADMLRNWGYQGLPGEDPTSWISRANVLNLDRSSSYGEIEGGRDIFPIYDHPLSTDGAPVWEVEDEDDVKVFAAPMSHGIPCVGYVVEEQSRPGRLRHEFVTPIVKRNLAALKDAGFKIPMKALAVIKNLPVGSAFTFPDGTVVTQEEAVEPPRKGRKVVICGDTASSRAITALAMDADVVVHEATNTYLAGIDRDTNLREVTRDTVVHGHSTPYLAGDFAKRVRAKKLVLNHFSARYKGDQYVDSLSIMMRLEGQAAKTSELGESGVAAAWDFMMLPVPRN